MKKYALLFLATSLVAACESAPPRPAPWSPPAPEVAPAPTPAPTPVAEPAPPPKAEGPWRVSLISVKSEPKAERLAQQFSEKGYRVEIETVDLEGTTWRRVVFPGHESQAEAKELLAKLEEESGIKGGWIPAPRKAEP